MKIAMLTSAINVLVVPVALLALVPTIVLDRIVGLATGILAALVVSLLAPFDVNVAILMLVQASVAGLVASPGLPAYVASKHAVIGLTKTAAGEVARSGVRVNAVCPGPIDTRMIHSLESMLNPNDPESVGSRYQQNIPLGRYGTAEEVASTALFLASDDAAFFTGEILHPSGGVFVG